MMSAIILTSYLALSWTKDTNMGYTFKRAVSETHLLLSFSFDYIERLILYGEQTTDHISKTFSYDMKNSFLTEFNELNKQNRDLLSRVKILTGNDNDNPLRSKRNILTDELGEVLSTITGLASNKDITQLKRTIQSMSTTAISSHKIFNKIHENEDKGTFKYDGIWSGRGSERFGLFPGFIQYFFKGLPKGVT